MSAHPNNSVLLVSAIACWCCFWIQSGQARDVHAEISDYLETNVAETNPEANIKKASEWLEGLKKDADSSFGGERSQDTFLIEALEKFTALPSLDTMTECNMNNLAILELNDRLTNGRVRNQPLHTGPLFRSEKILHEYAMKNAKRCMPIYLKNFRSMTNGRLNQTMIERVQGIMNVFIDEAMGPYHFKITSRFVPLLTGDLLNKYIKTILEIASIRMFQDYFMIDDKAQSLAANNRDWIYFNKVYDYVRRARVVHDEKVKELAEVYVMQPCEYYLKELGPEVYEAFEYDTLVLPKIDQYKVTEDDEDANDFYFGWAHYRLCGLVTSSDREVFTKRWMEVVSNHAE